MYNTIVLSALTECGSWVLTHNEQGGPLITGPRLSAAKPRFMHGSDKEASTTHSGRCHPPSSGQHGKVHITNHQGSNRHCAPSQHQ
jgi:hypothetical protein